LKHCKSSYKKWVHLYEARIVGVKPIIHKENSIFAKNRSKQFYNMTIQEQLQQYGYWDMKTDDFYPDCYCFKNEDKYYFKGIIATSRILRGGKYIIIFLGVEKGKYIELKVMLDKIYLTNKVGIKGHGKMIDKVIITSSVESF